MVSRNIAKRPNGRWRARYRDEAGKEHARHFDRKVDAQRWLDEVTASLVTGQYVDPKAGRDTFDAWFREWSSRQVWAPMTEVQADLIRRSVSFRDVPLDRLRESHLQRWVKEMRDAGFAANTIRTRMSTVRASLKAAVRDRRLASDPSVAVTLPRLRPQGQTMEVATSEEVAKLLSACQPRMRAFIAVCAFAGLRLGEASGLKVHDVDFLRRQVEVLRQVQKRRGGPSELRRPKYESERVIFASDELLEILAIHAERHVLSDEGFMFVGSAGQPIPPSTVNAWWTRTSTAATVENVTIHALRHHYASGLIAAGCDVVTVQRAMGHKSPSVTLNTYSHLWPTAEDRTRAASGELARLALRGVADSLRTADRD